MNQNVMLITEKILVTGDCDGVHHPLTSISSKETCLLYFGEILKRMFLNNMEEITT